MGTLGGLSIPPLVSGGTLLSCRCAGLSPAMAEELHPRIAAETHPVFHTLCTECPVALMQMAAERSGYAERGEGYVSKCDLCFDVRKRLAASGDFPELRPASISSA